MISRICSLWWRFNAANSSAAALDLADRLGIARPGADLARAANRPRRCLADHHSHAAERIARGRLCRNTGAGYGLTATGRELFGVVVPLYGFAERWSKGRRTPT
jgi:hypothetical protein